MKLALSNGQEIELRDASGNAQIDRARAHEWVRRAVEKSIADIKANKESTHHYCSSGDTFVLSIDYKDDKNHMVEAYLFKIVEHGWADINGEAKEMVDLRSANAQLDATNCARCGTELKDPGMGPQYKHCPVCEP